MATALHAPDPPFRLTAPIDHITKLDDGTLLAHVVVTSETPDDQADPSGLRRWEGEIVDYDAFKQSAGELMKWAVLGEMHDPSRMDAGTILQLHFDDAARRAEADVHVVDPTAVKKVLSRVYKMVSLGGATLASRLENVGGHVYRRLTKIVPAEVSLVPRGANPDAMIRKQLVLAKRSDMDTIDAGMAESPLGTETATGTVPVPAVGLILTDTRTPEQRAIDETREALAKDTREFSQDARDEMADKGVALPDGSFPIPDKDALDRAIQSIGRAKEPAAAKAHIVERAKALGATSMLPADWPGSTAGGKGKMKKQKAPDTRTDEQRAQDAEATRLAKEAGRLRKLRRAKAVLAKEQKRAHVGTPLAKGEQGDVADALAAVADATAEEAKEGDTDDVATLQAAGEKLKEFQADEAAEPADADDMEKQYRALRKQADRYRRLRKAGVALRREERRLAKAGARNSKSDMEQHGVIHAALRKLGYDGCMDKSVDAQAPVAGPTAAVASVVDEIGDHLAKSGAVATAAVADTMRAVLAEAGLRPGQVAAIEASLAAQQEQIAKMAKRSAGGGPATSFAPMMRGGDGSAPPDRGGLLDQAAAAIDQPRLREEVAQQASLAKIRQLRNG